MPSNRKKKQHYVPQCYLEQWAIENTHQINVYDKAKKENRQNKKSNEGRQDAGR